MIIAEDITLLLLTHENLGFLKRSVEYYSRLKCPKIILDSSAQPLFSASNVPDGFNYQHLPKDIIAKQRDVLDLIDTPYVLCAGCDDFFIPESLPVLAQYLNDHAEYVAAAGQNIGFRAQQDGYSYFLKQSQEYLMLTGRGSNNNVFARINAAITLAFGNYYSVMRTSAYREIITSDFVGTELAYPGFFDRYVAILLAILGNFKVLPVFFSARSVVKKRVKGRLHVPVMMREWPVGSFEEYTRMLIALASVLSRHSNLSVDAGGSIIDGAMRRLIPRIESWSIDDPVTLGEMGKKADSIDANLREKGELLVHRRDLHGMPFPEAEFLFPVYQVKEQVLELMDFTNRYPIEMKQET